MNIHIINDEKFTDFTINLFEEVCPNNNLYFVCIRENSVQYTKSTNIIIVKNDVKEIIDFLKNEKCEKLIIHFLDSFKIKILLKLKLNIPIVWLSWGADIYSSGFYKGELYHSITKRLLTNNSIKFGLLLSFKQKMKNWFKRLAFARAVSKIDFCATVIPDEYLILAKLPFFRAKQVFFSYASINEKLVDFKINKFKSNIFVGNSASSSSNHLDSFAFIKDNIKNLSGFDLCVVPLNYGNENDYKLKVAEAGERMFGDSFQPLFSYMGWNEYLKLLNTCRVAVLNHRRQQGLGSIILLLWLGCCVFLSEDNLIYNYLKNEGLIVYSLQSDFKYLNFNSQIVEADLRHNQKILLSLFSHEEVISRTKLFLESISDKPQFK